MMLLFIHLNLTKFWDFDHRTLLHIASENNAIDVARLLIDKGADFNAKTNIYQITFHQNIHGVCIDLFFIFEE